MNRKVLIFVSFGSPHKPTVGSLRDYYHHFFSDEEVFDVGAALRLFLREIIAKRIRAKRVANYYREIWLKDLDMSPLDYYYKKFIEKVRANLDGIDVYGSNLYSAPLVEDVIDEVLGRGASRVVVFYLTFQHCASVSGSIMKKIWKVLYKRKRYPEIVFLYWMWDDDEFLNMWAEHIKNHCKDIYDKYVVFSFHGVPVRHVLKSGMPSCFKEGCCSNITEENNLCYRAQCFYMAKEISRRLHIPNDNYMVAFQSRFGKDKWIEPYLNDAIHEIAFRGYRDVVIVPLSFPFDCLETLHELGIEMGSHAQKLGISLSVAPAINDSDAFVSLILNRVKKVL